MSGMERRALQFICLLALSSLSKANELQRGILTPVTEGVALPLDGSSTGEGGQTNPDSGRTGTGCREMSGKEAIAILNDATMTKETLKDLQDLYANKTLVVCPPASSSQKDIIVVGTGTAKDLLQAADKAATEELVRRMESKKVRRRHRSVGRLQHTASSHVVSCDDQTVAHMTPAHFRLLADSMKAHNCWSGRVGRLLSKLEADEQRSRRPRRGLLDPDEEDTYTGPSANEGYRIRCRFLLRFDTCRRNYLRLAELDPDTNAVFDWPQAVVDAMNQSTQSN